MMLCTFRTPPQFWRSSSVVRSRNGTFQAARAIQAISETTTVLPPPQLKGVWRPTVNDVQKISQGQAAQQRGTGSRGVPHRLNEAEQKQWTLAKQKGFLALAGSGYRRERKGSPLANTFRQWCDAKALPCVLVAKGANGGDTVLVDLSTLRLPDVSQYRETCRAIAQQHGCPPLPDAAKESPFTVILPPQLVSAMMAAGAEGSSDRSSDGSSSSSLSGADPPHADQGPREADSVTTADAAAEQQAEAATAAAETAAAAAEVAATAAALALTGSTIDQLLDELRATAVIWQQPPLLECFCADRNTAKTLAKQLAEGLVQPSEPRRRPKGSAASSR